MSGVRHIYTIARQAFCHVTVDFDPAVGATRFRAELQARMEAVTAFPQEADKFKIEELKTGVQAIIVVVRGAADTRTLQHYRDRLQARLSMHPEVGRMLPFPKIPYEVSIEIAESELRRYALSFDEIADTIRTASRDIPAGELKGSDGKLLIRSRGQAMTADDFATIILRPGHQGTQLKLGDIARISETLRKQDKLVRSDGMPAMEIIIPDFPLAEVSNGSH